MRKLIKKLLGVIEEVERERGAFSFAVCVERERDADEDPTTYDLLLAADWLSEGETAFRDYLRPKLLAVLTADEFLRSGAAILARDAEFISEFAEEIGNLSEGSDIRNIEVRDIRIPYAHIFRLKHSALNGALVNA